MGAMDVGFKGDPYFLRSGWGRRAPCHPQRTPNPTDHCLRFRGKRERAGLGVVSTKESRLCWPPPRASLSPPGLKKTVLGSQGAWRRGHRPARAFLTRGAGLRGRRLLPPARSLRLERMPDIRRRAPFPTATPELELQAYLLFKVNCC